MDNEKLTVLVVEPEKKPYVKEIEPGLESRTGKAANRQEFAGGIRGTADTEESGVCGISHCAG